MSENGQSWAGSFPRKWGKIALLVIPLIVGSAVRVAGIRHGDPDMVYHPDVAKQTFMARAIYGGQSDPRRLYHDDVERVLYPYGTAVLLGHTCRTVSAVSGQDGLDHVHRWNWALWMRWLNVTMILTAGAVVVAFYGTHLGLVSALATGWLLLLEPICAQLSHYGMNDVPLLAVLLASWVCSGRMLSDRARVPIFSALTGFLLGFGFGIKYQALLGFVFPGVAILALLRTKGLNRAVVAGVAVAIGAIAGALLACPLLRIDPGHFMNGLPEFMRWQASIMDPPVSLREKLPRNILAVGEALVARGGWILLIGAGGGGLSALRKNADGVVCVLTASAVLFAAVLTTAIAVSRDIIRENDLMPVSAFLVLLTGFAVAHAFHPARRRFAVRGIAAVLLIGLGAGYLATSAKDALALARTDTRRLAQEWCRRHVEDGSVLIRERYTLGAGKEGVRDVRFRYLSESIARQCIEAGRFDYAIASSLANSRFWDRRSPYYSEEAQAVYEHLRATCVPVATFTDRRLLHAHPQITVFRHVAGGRSAPSAAAAEAGRPPRDALRSESQASSVKGEQHP